MVNALIKRPPKITKYVNECLMSDSCGKLKPDSEFVEDSHVVLRQAIPPAKTSVDEQSEDGDNTILVSYVEYKQKLDEEANIDYSKFPEHICLTH